MRSITIVGFLLLLSACGSSVELTGATAPPTTADHVEAVHDDDQGTPDLEVDRVVQVTMTEFAYEPAEISVQAGETVRFIIANKGAIEHEFRLSDAHSIEVHLEAGHSDHETDVSQSHDPMVLIAAGQTDEVTVAFSVDHVFTHYACMIEGHYEAGMVGALLQGRAQQGRSMGVGGVQVGTFVESPVRCRATVRA